MRPLWNLIIAYIVVGSRVMICNSISIGHLSCRRSGYKGGMTIMFVYIYYVKGLRQLTNSIYIRWRGVLTSRWHSDESFVRRHLFATRLPSRRRWSLPTVMDPLLYTLPIQLRRSRGEEPVCVYIYIYMMAANLLLVFFSKSLEQHCRKSLTLARLFSPPILISICSAWRMESSLVKYAALSLCVGNRV